MITLQGISMNTDWREGACSPLPSAPGIYAEVCWPERAVRIGETGRSIRAKVAHDWRWMRAMHDGTAPASQLRRPHPICRAAIELGPVAFEAYTVSADPRLADKALRQELERTLFGWLEGACWVNWNRQVSWR
jgi:hypothetical protein